MKKKVFTIISLFVATAFWFIESAIHYFLFSESEFEFIPQNLNELWMRLVIILLIVLFGVFADSYQRKLVLKAKQSEAIDIYTSMIRATHHILNNLLNQTQLVKLEALNSKDFNKDVIQTYDTAFEDALELIKRLSSIEDITIKNIDVSVYPQSTDESFNKTNLENNTTN